MRLIKTVLCFLFFIGLGSLSHAQIQQFETWKVERQAELTGEEGWINLVDLIWFDEQKSFLNREWETRLFLSEKEEQDNLGRFSFSGDSVWFSSSSVTNMIPGSGQKQLVFPLAYGTGGLKVGSLKWSVIQRAGKFALRIRDLNHPSLVDFIPTPVFEYNSKFNLPAKFEPRFNETMDIPNVLGQLITWKVMGYLHLTWEGRAYRLLALDELGKLFVIFADETSAQETYPTGRYVYVAYPDRTGVTQVDFNYAYNPPCAYTDFATCQIPPKENRLPFAVVAGEKKPLDH
jgi:uncharacterized protein (DUF1684 family)